jgi:hypothetical protein
MSGEQFRIVHDLPLAPDTASDDCVRRTTLGSPSQNKAHIRQRQFHCGKPPPAALPVTMIFNQPPVQGWGRLIVAQRTAGK